MYLEFALACVLLVADLFTKWLAQNLLAQPISVTSFFRLALSHNTGVAFSIPIPNAVMLVAAPLLIAIFCTVLVRQYTVHSPITRIVLALFVAGGLGNFISRLFTGAVIDFIDFSFWPSFNLADAYLTTGAFLIILFYGKITKNHHGSS